MAEFVVRAATPADLPLIVQLEHAIFPNPWDDTSLAAELSADPRRIPLLAAGNQKPVGFAFAWRIADELHLVNLGVLEAWRRQGVGQRLLEAVLAAPRAEGARLITLEVRAGNEAARSFYNRNGFTEVAMRRRYYPDNLEDAVVMLRVLSQHQGQDLA